VKFGSSPATVKKLTAFSTEKGRFFGKEMRLKKQFLKPGDRPLTTQAKTCNPWEDFMNYTSKNTA